MRFPTIRTTLPKLLSYPIHPITYTKHHFQQLNIDHKAIQLQQQQQQTLRLKDTISKMKCNDNNAENYIKKLRINCQAVDVFRKYEEKSVRRECWILRPEAVKPRVFISARRKYIITSIKKAKMALAPLKKLYLHDAIMYCQNSQKKVAKVIVPTLFNLIRHALDRGYDPLRLFIHGIEIGKTQRYKGLRYHAKGRSGREKRDFCQVKVILYEKDQQEFWQQIGTGHAPTAFAVFIKQRLIEIKANHQKILEFTGITTSKGRQQKREILKRKIGWKMLQNKKAGIYIPKKIIQKQLYEEQSQKAMQIFKNLKHPNQLPSVRRREIVFKTNENN